MKSIQLHLIIAVTVIFGLVSCSQGEQNGDAPVETRPEFKKVQASTGSPSVRWECEMLGMYKHNGTAEASHKLDRDDAGTITGGIVRVDLNSILATDENFDPENDKTPEKLVGHLKSADFFDVANYPEATFEISTVDYDNGTIDGNLTIKGVSKKQVARFKGSSDGLLSKAMFKFNRSDFGLNWQHPIQENVLSEEIQIWVEIQI